MTRPGTIADRIEGIRTAAARWGGTIEVLHARVEDLEPIPGASVVFDPPYQGRTGYGWDLSREQVLLTASRWASVATIAVCEAEPLPLQGWSHVEFQRGSKNQEWLTLSTKPAVMPAQQVPLWGDHEGEGTWRNAPTT